jgi:hypothetical protein
VRLPDAVAGKRDRKTAAPRLGEEGLVQKRAVRRDLVVEAAGLARLAAVDKREDEVPPQQRLPAKENEAGIVSRGDPVDGRLRRIARNVRRPVPLIAVAAGEVATVGEVKRQVNDTFILDERPGDDHSYFRPRRAI